MKFNFNNLYLWYRFKFKNPEGWQCVSRSMPSNTVVRDWWLTYNRALAFFCWIFYIISFSITLCHNSYLKTQVHSSAVSFHFNTSQNRIKGCFDALDKKYVSFFFFYKAFNILVVVSVIDVGYFTWLCCLLSSFQLFDKM